MSTGRSSGWAMRYFLKHAQKSNWYVKIGDRDLNAAQHQFQEASKAAGNADGLAFKFDVTDANQRRNEIAEVRLTTTPLVIG